MPIRRAEHRPVVAIIGGGFTGAAVAYHLARAEAVDVVVFEPREALGAGLAYGDDEPVFRINVPATRMSLLPDDKLQFQRWIEETGAVDDDPDARASDGRLYPRRRVFGAYVGAQLAPLLASGAVRHVRDKAAHVAKAGARWKIIGENGAVFAADVVVLAATHPSPSMPSALRTVSHHRKFCSDLLAPGALPEAIDPDERILIVGSGLTAADAAAVLERRGHHGSIMMISRRGQRPQPQGSADAEPFGDFSRNPESTARALIARIRSTLAVAKSAGLEWQSVIDAVRAQGQTIWANLPVVERRRLVRHARPYWDAHRFRMAPQIHEVLLRGQERGTLQLTKASLLGAEARGEAFEVALRRNGRGGVERQPFDRIVLTTGPSHKDILRQPWLAALHDGGWISLDPTLLGLSTSRQGEALGPNGQTEGLFIAGPLARGAFGELMGLPEVSHYAVLIADQVAAFVRRKGTAVESAEKALARQANKPFSSCRIKSKNGRMSG